MNEILHANIFFLIASIATVLFCILICIILFQLIKILRSVRSIVERIEAGSEVLAGDLADIRSFFSDGGFFTRVINLLMGQFGSKKSRRKNKDE